VRETPLRCTRDEGRLIHRTDITPGLENLARKIPPNAEVVFSCYRLYGPEFTAKVVAARAGWDSATRDARARFGARGR
jgi:hypothetical protein